MSIVSSAAIPRLSTDATLTTLEYLDNRGFAFFLTTSKGAHKLLEKVHTIMYARIPMFGQQAYEDFWGVRITDRFNPKTISSGARLNFLKTFHGPNPIKPDTRVKDSCLTPMVVPKTVMLEDGTVVPFNLEEMDKLSSCPKMGRAVSLSCALQILEQHGKDEIEQEHLVLTLKEVFFRNLSWDEQVEQLQTLNGEMIRYGCETEPDASFIFNLVAHHTMTGDLPLSPYVYVRLKEIFRAKSGKEAHLIAGNFEKEGPNLATLHISASDMRAFGYGGTVQKKFFNSSP